ncbi:MAG: ankyrin repeat domain-containing protein [Pseudomonadota bacterium]|nr:ankyrin repeat domain-containing protein [Pseudomonadota bacterium]
MFFLRFFNQVSPPKVFSQETFARLLETRDHTLTIRYIESYPNACVAWRTPQDECALIVASRAGSVLVVEALLRRGMFIDNQDQSHYTALWYAAIYGHQDVVHILLSQGASLELPACNGPMLIEQCLHVNKQSTVIALLPYLEKKHINFLENLLFHALINLKAYDLVCALLHNGISCNIGNENNASVLMAACTYGAHEVLDYLLNEKRLSIDIDDQNLGGLTPLMLVCVNGDLYSAKKLLEAGAQVNLCSETQETALFFAVYYQFPKIVSLLLHYGANLSAFNENGLSVREIVARSGNAELGKIFDEYRLSAAKEFS